MNVHHILFQVSHRVEEDSYRDTIRIFNVVDLSMSQTIHFSQAAARQLATQALDVQARGVDIGRDCYDFNSLTHDIVERLRTEAVNSVVKYMNF